MAKMAGNFAIPNTLQKTLFIFEFTESISAMGYVSFFLKVLIQSPNFGW